VEEHIGHESEKAAARDYSDVGGHIASILNAAERAAEDIRAEASREAETLRREAETDVETHATTSRRQAEEEAERLVAVAAADARAIRDTARAAAERIADEGGRRLEELRLEARALEGRFERVVDDLRDLIAQLEHVVLNAADHPEADAPAERPHLTAAPEPEADADLGDDLWPRLAEVPAEPEAEEPAETRDGARSTYL
jgi:hypothetical protein